MVLPVTCTSFQDFPYVEISNFWKELMDIVIELMYSIPRFFIYQLATFHGETVPLSPSSSRQPCFERNSACSATCGAEPHRHGHRGLIVSDYILIWEIQP